MPEVFQLPELTVLDLIGVDAGSILHNLTTNEVKSLEIGCGCETFITDVRGKTLGHVFAFRTPEGYRMIGAAGQAEAIAAHADRYTIREDAVPTDRSNDLMGFVLSPDAPLTLREESDWEQSNAQRFDVDWLGEGTLLLLTETPGAVKQVLHTIGEPLGDEVDFHRARVAAGFPWYGIDLSEKNLPQEATRIEQSISFTKGCYLGQETVARLDALGQVQKQLVRWKTTGTLPEAGAEVTAGEKTVGRLTSIAPLDGETAIAIGVARRSHFEPGSIAEGDGFRAEVAG